MLELDIALSYSTSNALAAFFASLPGTGTELAQSSMNNYFLSRGFLSLYLNFFTFEDIPLLILVFAYSLFLSLGNLSLCTCIQFISFYIGTCQEE